MFTQVLLSIHHITDLLGGWKESGIVLNKTKPVLLQSFVFLWETESIGEVTFS